MGEWEEELFVESDPNYFAPILGHKRETVEEFYIDTAGQKYSSRILAVFFLSKKKILPTSARWRWNTSNFSFATFHNPACFEQLFQPGDEVATFRQYWDES